MYVRFSRLFRKHMRRFRPHRKGGFMVGTPTLFLVRDLVAERLSEQQQAKLQTALQHINAEPAYSYLGALGVNLFDFVPTTPPDLTDPTGSGRRYDAHAASPLEAGEVGRGGGGATAPTRYGRPGRRQRNNLGEAGFG